MDVICAVDGSRAAPGVVRYAANIASRAGTALRIVRAVQVADPLFVTSRVARAGRSMEDPTERREHIVALAQRRLEELAAEIQGVEASTELRQGTPDAEVRNAATEHDAPLVVIGTRARSGQRKALGTIGQRIVRRSSCPVLIVPEGYDSELEDPVTVLVGIRGGDRQDAATVVDDARKLVELMRADLVLAHSERDGRSAGGDADWLEKVAAGSRHIATHGDPSRELLRIAADVDADAIAVAPRGHGPLRQALLGSVSSALLSAGERPGHRHPADS
jgi:nucleotide-binding universal stress UspA family protein